MYKITDFKVGQKVALEVTGNEARRPNYKIILFVRESLKRLEKVCHGLW